MRIISGKYGRRRFDVPTNITARPTTDFARENIFNVLNGLTDYEGCRALDLFAGTGAVSIELLSRGCEPVTSVEKAATQYNFMRKVAAQFGDSNWHIVRGDALKFIDAATPRVDKDAEGKVIPHKPVDNPSAYDIIFCDPPYDLPEFGTIPARILGSNLVKPGTIYIQEHSKAYDFSDLPYFHEHRAYGSDNFSIFIVE